MRPKTIVLFLVAVGCGLVASIGVSQYMQQASSTPSISGETKTIFVAVTDINIGEKLNAQNVKLEEWPTDRVPEGAITELSDLEGHFTRQRLYVGEPILTAKLMDSSDRGSASLTIPKGYRVVSVKVSVESSVSGMVQPGDRVDLLVFLRKSAEIPETGTRTILRDVNVFSVDGETERSIDADTGKTVSVRTVSLLVKPEQAESVMLASELGRLSLSLRRPDDTQGENSGGETVYSLLGFDPKNPGDGSKSGSGFSNWLNSQNTPPPTVAPPITRTPPVVDEEAAWTMQILTGTGNRQFVWRDAEELPEEVSREPKPNASTAAQPVSALNDPNSPSTPQGEPVDFAGEEDLEEEEL